MKLKKYAVVVESFSGGSFRCYIHRAQNIMEATEMFWREVEIERLDACITFFIEEIG